MTVDIVGANFNLQMKISDEEVVLSMNLQE